LTDPRGTPYGKRRTRVAIENEVPVRTRLRRMARMKMRRYEARPRDAHVPWKLGVRSEHPAAQSPARVRVKMGDLPPGVYTGIGTAGADEVDRFRGHAAQSGLRHLLYRTQRPLCLPARESPAVVFQANSNATWRVRIHALRAGVKSKRRLPGQM